MVRFCSDSMAFRGPFLSFLCGCCFCLIATSPSAAQEPSQGDRPPQRWAVILVGLPGDSEHAAAFRKMADQIQTWLIESQQIPEEHVLRLPGEPGDGEKSAAPPTAEAMRMLLADVNSKLTADDSLWVFTLGHGNYDGRSAWFHVAGRDPSNEDFGRWLADVGCREQVIWLTHSSSGWFLKPLSRPGRIVIAATAADEESNETEFPRAFTTVAKWPVSKLDSDDDQAVSVAELYRAVVNEVARRFKSDERLSTEHAQLDDNGDGIGTGEIPQAKPDEIPAGAKQVPAIRLDGDLAGMTRIPYPDVEPVTDEPKPAE